MHARIAEAHESKRNRLESTLPKDHEGHIAEKGINSISQHNLVPKLVPVPKAIIIPSAKVGEARKVASVAIDQSEGQKGGHSASTKKAHRTVHIVATMMDI